MGCCRLHILPFFLLLFLVLHPLFAQPPRHPRGEHPDKAPLFFRAFPVALGNNQYKLYFFSDIIYDYLTFIKKEDGYQARFRMEVYLENQKTHRVYSASWKDEVFVKEFAETNRRNRFFLSCDSVTVPPGKYKLTYLFRDLQVHIQFKKMFKVDLPKIQALHPSPPLWCLPGQLENCQTLRLPCRPQAITKDLPFNTPFQLLLMGHKPAGSTLSVTVQVWSEKQPRQAPPLFRKDTTTSTSGAFFKIRIPLPSLSWQEGNYRIRIHYRAGEAEKTQTADFRVVWFRRPRSLNNIDEALKPLELLLPKDEIKKRFSGKKEEKVRQFIAYWKEKDPTPHTAFNEALTEFYSRVDTANMEWGTPQKPGWRTDTGRIFVLYGRPDEVEDHSLDPQNRYMVWIYHTPQGKRRFVFQALDKRRKYRLIREEKEQE